MLGLLTANAKSGLDQKEEELRRMATQVIVLDRSMAIPDDRGVLARSRFHERRPVRPS